MVAQESQCLRHLILTDVGLKGKCFEHLLLDDEQRTRFREFIEASSDAGLHSAVLFRLDILPNIIGSRPTRVSEPSGETTRVSVWS